MILPVVRPISFREAVILLVSTKDHYLRPLDKDNTGSEDEIIVRLGFEMAIAHAYLAWVATVCSRRVNQPDQSSWPVIIIILHCHALDLTISPGEGVGSSAGVWIGYCTCVSRLGGYCLQQSCEPAWPIIMTSNHYYFTLSCAWSYHYSGGVVGVGSSAGVWIGYCTCVSRLGGYCLQ